MRTASLSLLLLLPAGLAGQAQPAPPPLPKDDLPTDLYEQPLPSGLPRPRRVMKNPMTKIGFELGRKLFFDPILSADRTVSCASCHEPEHGFASPLARSVGVYGRITARNAPTLLNRTFGVRQGWDGSLRTIEQCVFAAIAGHNQMGLPVTEAVARLREHTEYRRLFDLTYDGGVTGVNVARALACFVRKLRIGASPVDRFQRGMLDQLTPQEQEGLWIYESKGQCWRCHLGANFTDERFHNTGVGVENGVPEDGRYAVTRVDRDRGRFKTPTLRGVALTAPYMHDGSLPTLEAVVDYYAAGGNANPYLSPLIKPLDLSAEDRANLVAFLKALSRS